MGGRRIANMPRSLPSPRCRPTPRGGAGGRPAAATRERRPIKVARPRGGGGFVPIDHHPRREDHGYRIDVSRDRSMITAVPIVVNGGGGFAAGGGGGRGGVVGRGVGGVGFDSRPPSSSSRRRPPPPPSPLRASPIVFGRPRLYPSMSNEAGSSGSSSWPTRGMLDPRGKQRRKMRSGGYATRPAAVAARRADATIHAAKDRLKQGGTTTTTTTMSGNIDNDGDDDDRDRDGDGDHPRDGTSGDRPPVPGSPKASSRDPNARPGRNAKVTWDAPVRSDKPRGGITPTSSSNPTHRRREVAAAEVAAGATAAAAAAAAAAWAWAAAVSASAAAEAAVMITWPVKKY